MPRGAGRLVLVMGLLALALGAYFLAPRLPLLMQPPTEGYDPARMVLVYATLPRLVMAVLCGAALGASGALLQQALRNPLASPTTLGIDAGARLALGAVTLFYPALFGWGRDVVALAGSGVAAALVFGLSRRQDFSPVALILSGLLVSLYCGALAAALTLVESRYLASLFVWGSGSLSQQSWTPTFDLAIRLAVLVVPIALLARPLSLLDLGEDAARGLGLNVAYLRLGAVALAVLLAAFTASSVGVIGFVGLVAPILVRLAGARSFGRSLAAATAVGALLLLLTDLLVQMAAGLSADFLPTGAVTALLGSPILLWLLPRVTVRLRKEAAAMPAMRSYALAMRRGVLPVFIIGALLIVLTLIALAVERAPNAEWQLLSAADVSHILPFRWPRVLAAVGAGLLLGSAGFLLQRLTGNEMASPEILGVSSGATFAMAVALFVSGVPSLATVTASAALGAALVLGLILFLSRRSGFQPERMLLAGIALSALLDAVIGVLSAAGDPRALQLLSWLTGAGFAAEPMSTLVSLALVALGIIAALCLVRWLDIFQLGAVTAQELGVPLGLARVLLLALVAGTTAVATPLVGPLTFVGFIAPNLVRLLGLRHSGTALLSSALTGAAILVTADWVARTVAFPFQLPTGLVASLVGAPLLLWLLQRRPA
ncbi:Fe(3+)-hydroxamate ABC transporter permease FhuB [Mesorhizobium sp. RP14(2022)]|uniref:Fe(3+)-hydroxamate ABC transporter permease FhuB n=1 Tax=Mesorhizobium liriopis TaxID=2953882 RepID=A0ABT1C5E8_9HYPH|nr:Fe(3+)-hydroxamate ABC transporter permease FhuB [Mesorhizobium liriopis]MCO6050052.1 Fe(3+)-hydroxamate ABC transporter permease FhuB [Mesorhizobium liriopis]